MEANVFAMYFLICLLCILGIVVNYLSLVFIKSEYGYAMSMLSKYLVICTVLIPFSTGLVALAIMIFVVWKELLEE